MSIFNFGKNKKAKKNDMNESTKMSASVRYDGEPEIGGKSEDII